jgi:hypothetical protein
MKKMTLSILVALILIAACSPTSQLPTDEPPQGGAVFINSADLLIMESYPVQIALHVTGDLPTPCHSFYSQVVAPDAENRIAVTVWSESDPELMCMQVLQPFDESVSIPMTGQPDGTYSVWLNGELVGEFNYPG